MMSETFQSTVAVLDFRRRRMSVQWNIASGDWSAHEEAPALVYGLALIRPGAGNNCLYGHDGALILQIGADQHVLADTVSMDGSPTDSAISIHCNRIALSVGFRREILVQSGDGAELFRHQYWIGSDPDFFKLLADKTASMAWRLLSASSWSAGVSSALLRESWAG